MRSKPDSTYYNRPDIEFNLLNGLNNKLCKVGVNTEYPVDSDRFPTARTTGNGLIYLSGEIITTSGVGFEETIMLLPEEFPINIDSYFVYISRAGTGTTSSAVFITGHEVITRDAFGVGQILSFDGIIYLQKFPL